MPATHPSTLRAGTTACVGLPSPRLSAWATYLALSDIPCAHPRADLAVTGGFNDLQAILTA
ncbi:MAG TPA: hypothetical protein VHD85_05275, partial [Terracidiphilus sp.]|nr:hypothetical protein [Terracidiphilus sp.]